MKIVIIVQADYADNWGKDNDDCDDKEEAEEDDCA